MLNGIFIALILSAVLWAAFDPTLVPVVDPATGTQELKTRMSLVSAASIDSARGAVEIALGLVGMMALWLGWMRVLRDAGGLAWIARGLAPLMRRLFPAVPADHPAMGAMILNMAANMLGLGNAATPFGLKAMRELDTLNDRPGVATDSMALFLAINTSGVAVFPLGVIAIRATLDSENAAGVFLPSVLATACSTCVGIAVALGLQRLPLFRRERYTAEEEAAEPSAAAAGIRGLDEAETVARTGAPRSLPGSALALACVGALIAGLFVSIDNTRALPDVETGMDVFRNMTSSWLLPLLMCVIILIGLSRRMQVYDSLIAGAREGFEIAIMIIPYLVAILVAVGMFRASGLMDALIGWVAPLTALVGFPAEALPMALIRPLSGSGAIGVMTETMRSHGPDSFAGFLVGVMNGSTETTFYVLALYYGSVRVRATRHTVAACLAADATGVAAALAWSRIFF